MKNSPHSIVLKKSYIQKNNKYTHAANYVQVQYQSLDTVPDAVRNRTA